MIDQARPATTAARSATVPDQTESERALGRLVALGLPAISLLAAVGIGVTAGVGSALLVAAAGGMLGCISLLWASVRTLSGDAPLAEGFEALAAKRHGLDALAEEKSRLLRVLKDLEAERALGKIEETDYSAMVASVRGEAKEVMRRMDIEIEPRRLEAERIVKEYLEEQGIGVPPERRTETSLHVTPGSRRTCAACSTSNEPDSTFCKKCGTPLSDLASDATT